MPIRKTPLHENTLSHYQNHSFEYMLLAWLLNGGWEASKPSVDLGSKTDVQVSDGMKLYRIQVKCLDTPDDNIKVENKWKNAPTPIDYVVYFSKRAKWGYILPAFQCSKKSLKSEGHIRFEQNPEDFLRAFENV